MLIAAVLIAAAVIGGFLGVGLLPVTMFAAVALGASVATVGVQSVGGRLSATAVVNLVASGSGLVITQMLSRAEVEGRTWDATVSRLDGFHTFERFFEMTPEELDLVAGVLVAGFAVAGLCVVIVLTTLGQWAAQSGAVDPLRSRLAVFAPGLRGHMALTVVLLGVAVFMGMLDGFHLLGRTSD